MPEGYFYTRNGGLERKIIELLSKSISNYCNRLKHKQFMECWKP